MSTAPATGLPSLWELASSGGPLMWPIALCSVAALALAIERALSLRGARLGGRNLEHDVAVALRGGGPARAVERLARESTPLARILQSGVAADAGVRERRVEDQATHEVRRLHARLRPLLLVYLVAPLIGLLGTVWGMIEAFAAVAVQGGLGRPELLASGVYQALVTTAAGLSVAIPTLVVHQGLRARVERFARRTEAAWRAVDEALSAGPVPGEVPRADP